jgi:hypothetical protein
MRLTEPFRFQRRKCFLSVYSKESCPHRASLRPTMRALDAGESARFSGIFSASAFFSLDGVPPSAPAQVTPAVGRLTPCKNRTEKVERREEGQMEKNNERISLHIVYPQ